MNADHERGPYCLTGTGDAFKSRQAGVFDNLNTLEAKHDQMTKSKTYEGCKREKEYHKTEPFIEESLESAFRKPKSYDNMHSHSSRKKKLWSNKLPDFRKNPAKWVKYDLSDVGSDQISDKANAGAAFSFLSERQKLKEELKKVSGNEDVKDNESTKLLFNKSKSRCLSMKSTEAKELSSIVSGKHTMPEYVVGETMNKKSKKDYKNTKMASGGIVSLGHLFVEDNEDG